MMDPILYWNEVALDANRDSHTSGQDAGVLGPPLSARALAIIHLAMYEAFAGASGNPVDLPPYLTNTTVPPAPAKPAAGTASPDAAVAAAARRTLLALHPSLAKDISKKYHDFIGTLTGPTVAPGIQFGETVADILLSERNNDPDVSEYNALLGNQFEPLPNHGAHRKDPDNPTQPFHAPFYGSQAKCFSVSTRYSLDAPPVPDSNPGEYLNAFKQVRGKGIAPELMGTLPSGYTKRTAEETLIGTFWGYDGAVKLGTPPRLYNQIVRSVAAKKGNTPAQNARLFALVNVAMADAGILAWADKYKYNYWRPVVAIREHDASMGPLGTGNNNLVNECDPAWLPLGAPKTNETSKKNFTPPFPAYPSGHASFGAAALQITRLFYGFTGTAPDNLFNNLTLVSEEFDGVNQDNKGTVRPRHTRNFPNGLMDMIEENGKSRVYLGVHWVFDAFAWDFTGNVPDYSKFVGGVPLGMRIAEDIFNGSPNAGLKKSTV